MNMLSGAALLLTIVSALIVGVVMGMYTTRAFLYLFFMRRIPAPAKPVGVETARMNAQAAAS